MQMLFPWHLCNALQTGPPELHSAAESSEFDSRCRLQTQARKLGIRPPPGFADFCVIIRFLEVLDPSRLIVQSIYYAP
jgi:hypothetical protein